MSERDADTPALAALRARLESEDAPRLWRSLDELAESPDLAALLERDHPRQAMSYGGASRRQFLQLMSASLALAGLGACTRQPTEPIVPYVEAPETIVPGRPLFYATAMPLGGAATGLLVESHMGRPTKVEGNPQHPASLGATDVWAQAAILDLYDPDRSQTVISAGEIRPWEAFLAAVRPAIAAQRANGGARVRILTETVISPTLARVIGTILAELPAARWHQWEPTASDGARAGARMAFGTDVDVRYRLDAADVILALDADLLACGPAATRHVRDFSARRRAAVEGGGAMSRLYAVESTPTLTGTKADHRLAVQPGAIIDVAWTIASRLAAPSAAGSGPHAAWIDAVVGDLTSHRGTSLVVAGPEQPAHVHALAHLMNQQLANVGRTVEYTDPVAPAPVESLTSLRELVAAIDAETVDVLFVIGGNPVYTAPADLAFAERLAKVALRVHLGLYQDETSLLCHWHVPEAHFLESWGDARAYDGTATIMQPLIAPLYEGKTAAELLTACFGEAEPSAHDLVRETWQPVGGADFERFWRRALHDGVVPGTTLPARRVTAGTGWVDEARRLAERAAQRAGTLEILFRLDPTVLDGRFANNGWLQELPKPLSKLTWDNAVLIGPATAARLGLANQDVVELRRAGRTVRGAVWIVPGQAPDTLTVHFGYGRTRAGRNGDGRGFDAYALRTSDAPWAAAGVDLSLTGDTYALACTQEHHRMEGRPLVRTAPLEQYRADPHVVHHGVHDPPRDLTLYPEYEYDGYAWGMAIDTGACVGCNACMVACQSENNIPIVGKDEVIRGREMHWLRVDRYFEGDPAAPTFHHQPVPCMHCENAPCEVVCPVNATVHSSEGLNDQVYNRCVGTKYCSNNCPYKVRRFNFYLYNDWETESLKLGRNPDVTVRSRGIMEKCTYCVQRINYGRIEAHKDGRRIRDGEIVTACQQACPADAIVFGDINDPESRVAQLKKSPRSYGLLADLNTRPRTTYLASITNPNPAMKDES
jgi:MoCo/4Fe-4S cofactor protein with predicted Tat translocation signal